MSETKAITYTENREAFFVKKLKKAERGLDNLMRYGTDPDACVKSGEEVSFYRDALAALREQAERVLCAKCKHYNKTGCSAGFGWCENMDRGTHDEFYCASGKRLEVEP